jgi:hypothetical protein
MPVIGGPGSDQGAQFGTSDHVFYVSSATGSDTNSGRAPGVPFASLAAAITAAGSGPAEIRCAAPSVQLTGAITIPAGAVGIRIVGIGKKATQIVVNGNYDAIHATGGFTNLTLENLTIVTFAARTSGVGLNVAGTSGAHADGVRLVNVEIINMPQAINAVYVDNMHWTDVRARQNTTGYASASAAGYVYMQGCIDVHLRSIEVMGLSTALLPCPALVADTSCDTITMDNVEGAYGTSTGLVLQNTVGSDPNPTGPRLVKGNACYFESFAGGGYVLADGRDTRFTDCHGALNGQGTASAGWLITGGTSTTLRGCNSFQSGGHGIAVIGSSARNVTIDGCNSSNSSQDATNTYDGLHLGSSAQHVHVIGGRYWDGQYVTTPASRYGIYVESGVDFCSFLIPDVDSLGTGAVNFASPASPNNTFIGVSAGGARIAMPGTITLGKYPGITGSPNSAYFNDPLTVPITTTSQVVAFGANRTNLLRFTFTGANATVGTFTIGSQSIGQIITLAIISTDGASGQAMAVWPTNTNFYKNGAPVSAPTISLAINVVTLVDMYWDGGHWNATVR